MMRSTKTLMLATVAAFALGSAAMAQSQVPSPNQGAAYQWQQETARSAGYGQVQTGSSDVRVTTTYSGDYTTGTYSGDYTTGRDYTTLANPG